MTPSAERDVVDRGHLDRLGARFGPAFVVQMIDLFLGEGSERVDAAQTALAAGDVAGVTAAAHALKSSAGNLGATALMTCAAEVERIGREAAAPAAFEGPVDALVRSFDRARTVLADVREELSR